MAESTRCLQCTCEAIGFCDLRRLGIEYGTTLKTLEPENHQGAGYRSRHREPVHRHQPRLHPRRFPRVHPARAVALHRLRALRQRLRRGRRRRVLRLHAHRLRHARHDAARHEPQRHAVRVVRALRGDVPDRRADAEAARPREVRGRREPLHPVRDLRRRLPVRRAARRRRLRARPYRPRRADDRPDGARRRSTARPRSPTSGASATGLHRAARRGPDHRPGPAAAGAAADAHGDRAPARATGTANGHGHGTATARSPRSARAATSSRRCARSSPRSSSRCIVMGAVLGIAALMLVLSSARTGRTYCLWILAAVMIGSGLLVVTMRDIIRCGLAMIVCFVALAGIYVLMGAPLLGRRAGHRLHRRDQRADPVRDHAHPDEGRARPGWSSRPRPARRRSPRSSSRSSSRWRSRRPTGASWPARCRLAHRRPCRGSSSRQFVFPFEIVSVLLLAAVIGGVFLAKREPGGPS